MSFCLLTVQRYDYFFIPAILSYLYLPKTPQLLTFVITYPQLLILVNMRACIVKEYVKNKR